MDVETEGNKRLVHVNGTVELNLAAASFEKAGDFFAGDNLTEEDLAVLIANVNDDNIILGQVLQSRNVAGRW